DAHVPHESPLSMTAVLMILAFLSFFGGFVGWPFVHPTPFQGWLEPVVPLLEHESELAVELGLMAASVGIAAFGIFIAYLFYKRDESFSTAKRLATQFAPIYNMIANKYYVDEIYNGGLLRATVVFAQALAWFDTYIIDGMVNLVRNVTVYLLG